METRDKCNSRLRPQFSPATILKKVKFWDFSWNIQIKNFDSSWVYKAGKCVNIRIGASLSDEVYTAHSYNTLKCC